MGKVPGAASVSTITDVRDVNLMPNIDVVTPVSSAPTERLVVSTRGQLFADAVVRDLLG